MEASANDSQRSVIIPRLRVYEWALLSIGAGAFLILLGSHGRPGALAAEVGAGVALYSGALIVLSRKAGLKNERLRLAANYLFTIWFYGATSRITGALGTPTLDARLLACDAFLFGRTPAVSLDELARSWLSDVLSLSYLSYLIYLQVAVIWAFGQPERVIRRFDASIFAGFASGFLTYLLLPALGPGAAFPKLFSSPIQGGFLTWLNDAIVSRGAAIYGTFPSLHLLMTMLLLENDWHNCRVRFWIMLGPAIGLTISTMYLRYHYATDLLAGLAYFFVIHAALLRCNKRL